MSVIKVDEWVGTLPLPLPRSANDKEFATCNQPAPHLFVEVPDGTSTISCLTSDGKKVCIAFLPYEPKGPPKCVDIMRRDDGRGAHPERPEILMHDVKVFSAGGTLYHNRKGEATITSVLLDENYFPSKEENTDNS